MWTTATRSAGALRGTIRSLNRNSASATTRDGAGVAFIITPPCALQPTVACWRNVLDMTALKKILLDQKYLPYPKITSRAAVQRAQRHVPDSIATLRFVLACNIIRKLDRCPCCNIRKQR